MHANMPPFRFGCVCPVSQSGNLPFPTAENRFPGIAQGPGSPSLSKDYATVGHVQQFYAL